MVTRKLLLAIYFCFLISSITTAQSGWHIGKFKVKKIDFSFGFEQDFVNDLDYKFFTNQLPVAEKDLIEALNFDPSEFHSGVCENPSINVGLTLTHPKLKNFEWRNAFAFKRDRVDAVSYYNSSTYEGNYMNIWSYHSEFAFESALIYAVPVSKFFNLYGGVGTNLGITGANTTCVSSTIDITANDIGFRNIDEINNVTASQDDAFYNNCFDTGSQFNQRVFAQVGFGIKFFQRVELGLDFKSGYGYRADFGNGIDKTHIVATNFNLRYILR